MFHGTNDFLVTFSIKNLNFGYFLRNRVAISFLLVILLSLCIYPLFRKSSICMCGGAVAQLCPTLGDLIEVLKCAK